MSLGQTVSGALEATDPLLQDNSHFDTWIYEGRRGDSVQISLESSDFDAFLLLFRQADQGPEQVAENDDGGGGSNARITVVLPEDGTYAVLANSYGAGQTGAYRLRIEGRASDQSSTQNQTPPSNWAARYRGGGDPSERYALLVGIDDYEGTGASTLDGPVADANLIGRVLVERFGFRRENVVTIADREATREHIVEAFLRHLGQAGPDGVAVFYYSGHGMQMPNNVALTGSLDPETDNRDEALAIRGDDNNGSILLDDELGFLSDRLRTNRVLFIVDACFSGTGTRAIGRAQPKETKFEEMKAKLTLPARYLTDGASAGSSASGGIADALGEPQRHVLLAASAENQLSYTAEGWPKYTGKNSVFTYYLAEALEGASPTATFAEVMRHVTSETDSYVQRQERKRQTPQAEGQQAVARIRDFLAKR
ncbi:MAG: caspase family protein [Gemmatimonadaceae bacterium]